MSASARSKASDQAKLPHNATFVRLGKKVWFMLEHSQRVRSASKALESGLVRANDKNDDIAQMGIAWMGVGNFDDRRVWNDDQWIAFLRTWQHKAGYVFTEEATMKRRGYVMHSQFTGHSMLPYLKNQKDTVQRDLIWPKQKKILRIYLLYLKII